MHDGTALKWLAAWAATRISARELRPIDPVEIRYHSAAMIICPCNSHC